jgi:hypothetical protein
MMNQIAVSQKDALEVASVFMNAPTVIGVDLVGSVAREGKGNDLDMVLLVSPFRYASFVRSMMGWDEDVAEEDEWEDSYMFGGYKSSRRKAALEIVALTPVLSAWLECATRSFNVDLFLMPEGWRKHADEVQKHLPHRDPQFVRHIATDAVTLKRHKIGGIVRATR